LLDEFPEEMKTTTTPATDYLFKVREEGKVKPLPEEQAFLFHWLVARLVWVQAQGRRDIQTPVLFLMTKVKAPDEDDWGNLKRKLHYIKVVFDRFVLRGACLVSGGECHYKREELDGG
jgi:hypothetical protein